MVISSSIHVSYFVNVESSAPDQQRVSKALQNFLCVQKRPDIARVSNSSINFKNPKGLLFFTPLIKIYNTVRIIFSLSSFSNFSCFKQQLCSSPSIRFTSYLLVNLICTFIFMSNFSFFRAISKTGAGIDHAFGPLPSLEENIHASSYL